MSQSLHSPFWYRVANLRPRLRSHMAIHRHFYRGDLWYVLQDHVSGRFQRFTPSAYTIIGLMDGRRAMAEIWETARSRLGEDAPTQEEVIRLLSQLHAVDALRSDALPDTGEMLQRFEKQQYGKLKQNIRNPMFMRFSLLDPERILIKLMPLMRPVFGWAGMLLWLAVVGYGVSQAALYWPNLTENITDRVLALDNLVLIWVTFPFLKAFHEFGHAFAVKARGGEVHEMGIMFLVFTPIPYVDASAASAFRKKRERILVSAAGMMTELFIAAIALFLWIDMEPGTVRAVLYNIMLIAGVSTILFNGNPLLRYDAYYILSDLVEIPNLGPRGIRYVVYLLQRYLLGAKDVEKPMLAPGERPWLVGYTIVSFFYRIFIYVGIILFVASKFFVVGVLIAIWGLFTMFVMPLGKALRFLFTSPKLRRRQLRAFATTALLVGGVAGLIFFYPAPLRTQAEGVVWIPEDAFVRAGADGFVERVAVPSGTWTTPGERLIVCEDPLLPARIRVLESRLRELRATYDAQWVEDRVAAAVTAEEMAQVTAEIDDARQRAEDLTVISPRDGWFIVPDAEDLPGRFVHRGELLGYVLDRDTLKARVVVSQGDVDFVRHQTEGVRIRFPERMEATFPATLPREVPAGTDQLPSRTLSVEGGGEIAIDPRDASGVKTFKKVFLFDIGMPPPEGLYKVGGRIFVRFDHGEEPLAWRWYRGIRRLFLRRFNA